MPEIVFLSWGEVKRIEGSCTSYAAAEIYPGSYILFKARMAG